MDFLDVISQSLFPDECLTTILTGHWLSHEASLLLELQLYAVVPAGVVLQSLQSHTANLSLELFADRNSAVGCAADVLASLLSSKPEYSTPLPGEFVLIDWNFKRFDDPIGGLGRMQRRVDIWTTAK